MKSKEYVLGNHLFYSEEEIKKVAETNLNVKRALAAMEEYAGQFKEFDTLKVSVMPHVLLDGSNKSIEQLIAEHFDCPIEKIGNYHWDWTQPDAIWLAKTYAGQSKWIPVGDWVPKANEDGIMPEVICCNEVRSSAFTATYDDSDGKWYEDRDGIEVVVTHWQPKPELPTVWGE